MKTYHLTNGPARVTISVAQGATCFNIYLPNGGPPANIAAVLLAVAPRLRKGEYDAGQLAADIVACVDPKVRARLVTSPMSALSDYLYIITRSATSGGPRVQVKKLFGGSCGEAPLFEGELDAFTEWAVAQTGLEELVNKVVQFKYDGGSSRGETRTIRVEKVERSSTGEVSLEGYDLAVVDLKMGLKKYLTSRITGDVVALN